MAAIEDERAGGVMINQANARRRRREGVVFLVLFGLTIPFIAWLRRRDERLGSSSA